MLDASAVELVLRVGLAFDPADRSASAAGRVRAFSGELKGRLSREGPGARAMELRHRELRRAVNVLAVASRVPKAAGACACMARANTVNGART